MTESFEAWFAKVAADKPIAPPPRQAELGGETSCRDRLIRIPTGFGKTAGVVLAWLDYRSADPRPAHVTVVAQETT